MGELSKLGDLCNIVEWLSLYKSQKQSFFSYRYCQNMDDAHAAVTEIGENHPLLVNCQKELGHQLPLSSYLLKPVQRLTKYQLLMKDLQSAGILHKSIKSNFLAFNNTTAAAFTNKTLPRRHNWPGRARRMHWGYPPSDQGCQRLPAAGEYQRSSRSSLSPWGISLPRSFQCPYWKQTTSESYFQV